MTYLHTISFSRLLKKDYVEQARILNAIKNDSFLYPGSLSSCCIIWRPLRRLGLGLSKTCLCHLLLERTSHKIIYVLFFILLYSFLYMRWYITDCMSLQHYFSVDYFASCYIVRMAKVVRRWCLSCHNLAPKSHLVDHITVLLSQTRGEIQHINKRSPDAGGFSMSRHVSADMRSNGATICQRLFPYFAFDDMVRRLLGSVDGSSMYCVRQLYPAKLIKLAEWIAWNIQIDSNQLSSAASVYHLSK